MTSKKKHAGAKGVRCSHSITYAKYIGSRLCKACNHWIPPYVGSSKRKDGA